MIKNFQINSAVELVVGKAWMDLHNGYDLSDLRLTLKRDALWIVFQRLQEANAGNVEAPHVMVEFSGLRYVYISNELYSQRSWGLEEVGYKPPDDFDMDWLLDESKFELGFHICFRFENDEIVRIGASQAICRWW